MNPKKEFRRYNCRARARGLRADHIARARKVDKAKFLTEFDQEMLLGKTFNTGADRART